MLKARLSNGVFILGLDAENIKRLQAGRPIMLSLSALGGTDDIAIMYGETLADIQAELEQVSGEDLPQPSKANIQ